MVVVKLRAHIAGSTMVNVLPPVNVALFADKCMAEIDLVVVLIVICARYVCEYEAQVACQPYRTEYVKQKRRYPQAISVHEVLCLKERVVFGQSLRDEVRWFWIEAVALRNGQLEERRRVILKVPNIDDDVKIDDLYHDKAY